MAEGTVKQYIIPLQTLKSGQVKYKSKKQNQKNGEEVADGCHLVYEDNTSKIFFKVIDQTTLRKIGKEQYTTLEFDDITAADLKVVSKFGSWDTMSCRLLLENYSPLPTWTVENVGQIQEITKSPEPQQMDENETAYVRRVQESCMVKATFDIKDLQNVRDVLHQMKINKLRERKIALQKQKNDIDKRVIVPSKIREGLPEWVNYIPAKWYSSTVRQVFEYMIVIYTLLTLMWAIWQLYKHVGFIRQILRPFLEIIELYLEVLRAWFHWLDHLTDILTDYWWMYMKPFILLAAPLYSALASLFKPLRNVANVVSMVTQPVTSMFQFIMTAFRPLVQPMLLAFKIVKDALNKLYKIVLVTWGMMARWSFVRLVAEKLQGMGLARLIQEISNSNLDPLKAQVVLIQNLLVRSSKQIYYGLRFIFLRIYYMSVFVKRERDYARENEALDAKKETKNKTE